LAIQLPLRSGAEEGAGLPSLSFSYPARLSLISVLAVARSRHFHLLVAVPLCRGGGLSHP